MAKSPASEGNYNVTCASEKTTLYRELILYHLPPLKKRKTPMDSNMPWVGISFRSQEAMSDLHWTTKI